MAKNGFDTPELRSLDDVALEVSPPLLVAERFVSPMLLAAGAMFTVFLLSGGYVFWTATPLFSALFILQLLACVALLCIGLLSRERAIAARDVTRRNEEIASYRTEVASAQKERGDVLRRYYTPLSGIAALERWGRRAPWTLVGASSLLVFGCVRALLAPTPDVSFYANVSPMLWVAGVANVALAFGGAMLSPWLRAQNRDELPEARALSALVKATQWVALLVALVAFARALNFDNVATLAQLADAWLGRVLVVVVGAIALEVLAIAALDAVAKNREWRDVRLPLSATLADTIFTSPRELVETLSTLETRLGLNVRSSYVLARLRRGLPFVALGVVALLWLSTSMTTIGTEETGVLTRFGKRVTETPLGPGLHFKLPFPIDVVRVLPTERVQVAVVGPPLDTSKPILWTKVHAGGDHNQVLGEGREVVSVHARVFFRVKDAQNYVFNTQNLADLVESLAYKTMMREIVHRDINQILSIDRGGFATRLKNQLQRVLDSQKLGIEVISFPLIGLHPPVDVAKDYQSVVSAQIAQVTTQTQANTERITNVLAAEASRDATLKKAQGASARRLAGASGESNRFKATEDAYNAAPQLYKERLWIEGLEETLEGKKIFVVDQNPTKPRPDYTLDLRPAGSLP